MWRDGSTLEFQPENHWPPGTELTASIKPAALAKDLKLDTTTVTTTTPPLVADIHDFSFYNSPKDPSVYQVVAELKLSHPVAIETLQEKLRMEVIGGTPVFTPGTPLFTVTADPLSARNFFIRSRQIVVPLKEDWVKLIVPAGIASTLGGQPLAKDVEAKTRVPDKYSGLKIESAETMIIRTDEGEPQQFVFVTTNLDIDSAEIASRIGMWWHRDGWYDNHRNLIFDERVGSATKVALIPVESEAALSKRHAFRFLQAETSGSLCLRIGEGVKSPGGFETNTRFEKVLSVPRFPKETRLLGKGNILALDGERKLVVQSRGVDHLRVTLGRVPDSQFQHLVALTGHSSFDDPDFSGNFSQNDIVHRWSKVVEVPRANDWEASQSVDRYFRSASLGGAEPASRRARRVLRHRGAGEGNGTKSAPDNDIYSRIETADRYDESGQLDLVWR